MPSKKKKPGSAPTEEGERFDKLMRAQKGDTSLRPWVRDLIKERGGEGLQPLHEVVRDTLLKRMCETNVLLHEDILYQMSNLKKRLAGDNPSSLESLLIDRITLCWLHLHYYETLYAQGIRDLTLRQGEFHQKRIDMANRRYLLAIKSLAQVRRLQLPTLQVNLAQQQINVAEKQINLPPAAEPDPINEPQPDQ